MLLQPLFLPSSVSVILHILCFCLTVNSLYFDIHVSVTLFLPLCFSVSLPLFTITLSTFISRDLTTFSSPRHHFICIYIPSHLFFSSSSYYSSLSPYTKLKLHSTACSRHGSTEFHTSRFHDFNQSHGGLLPRPTVTWRDGMGCFN